MRVIRSFLKNLAMNGIFRPYYFVRTSRPAWFYVLNHEGRRLYIKNRPRLDAIQERIVRDLKKEGIALTHLSELFPERNILPELQKYTAELQPHGQVQDGKPFLKMFWNYSVGHERISFDLNPFIRLALEKKALDVVNSYLEMFSKFFYFSLAETIPDPQQDPIRSQRWHRDPDDIKLCKIFIYVSDVDEEAGPFTYVRQSHLGGRWRGVFEQKIPQRVRPDDGVVEKLVPREYIKVCTGKAGTVIFCDTSGLHRGGLAKSKHRFMFTAEYSAAGAMTPILYDLPKKFQEEINRLGPAAVYATSNHLSPIVKFFNVVSFVQRRYCRY